MSRPLGFGRGRLWPKEGQKYLCGVYGVISQMTPQPVIPSTLHGPLPP